MYAATDAGTQRRTFPLIALESPGSVVLDGHTHRPPLLGAAFSDALEPAQVREIALRMLRTRDPAERDQILAATLNLAAGRAGGKLPATLGAALGGLLKSVARQRLRYTMPGAGLGIDLAGLNPDAQAFKTMVQFIRLAGEAARHSVEEQLRTSPHIAARTVLAAAAEIYAPPLLQPRTRTDVWNSELASSLGPSLSVLDSMHIQPFNYDPNTEYFLGRIVRSATRAVGKIAQVAAKAADTVGRVPVLGDITRAGIGAARLTMGPAAIAIDAGSRLARGESLANALKGAVKGQIDAVRDQLKLAEMVAPFVPGVGAGVAAALGVANALAAGRPITEAVLAAARSAVPGGAIAQAAFDVAMNLAKGKNISSALIETARDRLPGGPAARAAFDTAVALAQGKRLQDAAFAAAGRILPPSPYAADALAFARGVANGQSIQSAALSVVGRRALQQVRAQAVLAKHMNRVAAVRTAGARIPGRPPGMPAAAAQLRAAVKPASDRIFRSHSGIGSPGARLRRSAAAGG
jgi:hypothetical protein